MTAPTPLCRGELPSAVHAQQGSTPIRCTKRLQCQQYVLCQPYFVVSSMDIVDWACEGNRFDRFVAVELMGS